MKMKMNASDKYIAAVKRRLRCSLKTKNKLLETLIPEIRNFELSNPTAQYEDYVSEFGTPKFVASEYMKELSEKEKFFYWLPLISAVSIVIIAAFAFLIAVCISQVEDSPGYVVEGPVEILSEPEHIFN